MCREYKYLDPDDAYMDKNTGVLRNLIFDLLSKAD